MSIDANSLSLNRGTIKDSTDDIDAVLNHRAVAANAGHKVDGVKPELATAVGAVANGATLTLTYDEPLDGTSMPAASTFTVAGGSQSRTVSGVRVSGSTVELTVDPAVEQAETGIRVSYTVPTGMGASPIRDAVGNAALGLSSEPVTNETPDTIAPTVSTGRNHLGSGIRPDLRAGRRDSGHGHLQRGRGCGEDAAADAESRETGTGRLATWKARVRRSWCSPTRWSMGTKTATG